MAKDSYEKVKDKGFLKKAYEKIIGKGMDADDVYEKIKSSGDNLSDQLNYVKEMRKDIESQHPKLVAEKTKKSLKEVEDKINYEKGELIEKGDKALSKKEYTKALSAYDKAGDWAKAGKVEEDLFKEGNEESYKILSWRYRDEGDKEKENRMDRKLGYLYLDGLGKTERASAYFYNIHDLEGIKRVGEKFREEGKVGLAEDAYERALNLDPENEEIKEKLEDLKEK